jgi:hypothetical protein
MIFTRGADRNRLKTEGFQVFFPSKADDDTNSIPGLSLSDFTLPLRCYFR